jgi:hypothetical protein
MNKAIEHIDKHKVFVEEHQTEMVPIAEVYIALQLSFDNQITDVMSMLQDQILTLSEDLGEVPEELDIDKLELE